MNQGLKEGLIVGFTFIIIIGSGASLVFALFNIIETKVEYRKINQVFISTHYYHRITFVFEDQTHQTCELVDFPQIPKKGDHLKHVTGYNMFGWKIFGEWLLA